MTILKIRDVLYSLNMLARIQEDFKNNRVIFRLHPENVFEAPRFLDHLAPVGVEFVYKPMRLWDYWLCRKKLVVIG